MKESSSPSLFFSYWKMPLWIGLAVIIFDHITKWTVVGTIELYRQRITVIPDFFDLIHTRNTGAAWSMFNQHTEILAAFSLIAGLAMIFWFTKLADNRKLQAVGLALIIGGTFGNFIDRAFLGYVIDFLAFTFGNYHFPAFNIADSAISIGAALFILDSFRQSAEKRKCAK